MGTIATPIILVGQEMTEEFGGGLLFVFRTLNVEGALVVDSGLTVTSSVVKRLGNGYDIQETKQLISGGWPVLTSQVYDEEMQNWRYETEQIVDPATVIGYGTYYVESLKAVDKWRSKKVRVTRTPVAVGPGTAIVTYQYLPYRFPGVVYTTGLGLYYVRRASAQLCKHTIKTWWQVSAGTPPSIAVSEIIQDNVIINNLNNSGLEYSGDCLHDDMFIGSIFYPATTPTGTLYRFGVVSGTTTTGYVLLAGLGSGYFVNDHISFSGGGNSASLVVTAIGPSGECVAYNVLGSTLIANGGPYTATGGHGTGAAFDVSIVTVPTYVANSAWIGQEKIISASVTPTEIPSLWKCQTKSVVMR